MEITNRVDFYDLTNISGLCRICLTESKKMLSLYTEVEEKLEEDVSTFCDILCRITGEQISDDNRYPSYVCRICVDLLNKSYKFKMQYEKSHKLLREYFGECLLEDCDLKSIIEIIKEDPTETVSVEAVPVEVVPVEVVPVEAAPVELISKQGKYDLKDVLIVENAEEEKPDFSGFLKNLGSVVSATFVSAKINTNTASQVKKYSPNTVSVINLSKSESTTNNNDTNYELPNEVLQNLQVDDNKRQDQRNLDDDMDENDKELNRNIGKCAVCHKVFSNKKYIKRHVERMHLHKRQTFVCEICGVCLKSRSSHYHHMIKHCGKRHKCSHCQKTYFNASNLQQHIMAVHKNERPHLCTICGKSFSYANALDYHMRIHTGERKYKCSYCDKTFTMQCGLNRHLRIHTGHRPYQCKYCEKAFRSKGEVDCHEMIHTGYRPYHCKYCNKGFTKTFNLKMHLLGHAGPHVCEICEKTFIELEYLKSHMTIAHGYKEREGLESDNETFIIAELPINEIKSLEEF